MSPSQFHAEKEITSITTKPNNNNNNINGMLPPPLKINKASHFIKKSTSSSSPPSSSSSSSSSTSSSHINSILASNKPPQQQRQPVIIYTHSPRVINTNPKDFMALVQKLTGFSHKEEEEEEEDGGDNVCDLPSYRQPKQEPGRDISMMVEDNRKKAVVIGNEDNDASSVITEENNCSSNSVGESQINSCFNAAEPPMYEPPPLNPYMTNLSDFMCFNQPLLNYSDSFFSHKMRTSIPPFATLEEMEEGFRNY